MPYRTEELQDRLQIGEDNRWEFKSVDFRSGRLDRHQRDLWAEEIVAFANASGGSLLLGVADNGSIEGMSREELDIVERRVTEICRDSIKPTLAVEIYREQLDDRAFVVVVVPPGYAQHEYDGRSHIRIGSSRRLMTSDERLRLALRRGQARRRSFDHSTVANTGFATLSERLWKPLLSAESLSDPQIGLEKLGLLATDDHDVVRASVAGILFCTESPEQFLPQAAITAVKYRGSDETSGQIDAQDIVGPIDQQIRYALAFATRNMRVAARKTPAREDLPEYSTRAIFEALVNAVAHRDYSISASRIRLRMFSDRLEIRSPGSLPNSLTIESMPDRQATRNEVLNSILGRMNAAGIEAANDRRYFMERRGDGVPIIRRQTQELTGKLPEYRLIDDSELCLVIPAAALELDPASVTVTVRRERTPLVGATVLALFPNNTWKSAVSDEYGEAQFDFHSVNLPMTVFAASSNSAAHVERDWVPAERSLAIDLAPLSNGGSVVFSESTGHIPGLAGRLNPILDTRNRTYLYASNIAVNGGQPQPVTFSPGSEELHLMDANGRQQFVRIVAMSGRSSLVEYRDASIDSTNS